MEGEIKFFDKFRFFGIVRVTDEYNEAVAEFFLHGSQVIELLSAGYELRDGTPIRFWLDDSPRMDRLMCVDIELMDANPRMVAPSPATANPTDNVHEPRPDLDYDEPDTVRGVYYSEFKRSTPRRGHAHVKR